MSSEWACRPAVLLTSCDVPYQSAQSSVCGPFFSKLQFSVACSGTPFDDYAEVRCVCHFSTSFSFVFTKVPTIAGDGVICVRYWKNLTPNEEDELLQIHELKRYILSESGQHNIWYPTYSDQVIYSNFTLEFWTSKDQGVNFPEDTYEFEMSLLSCEQSDIYTAASCLATGTESVPEAETDLPETGMIPIPEETGTGN